MVSQDCVPLQQQVAELRQQVELLQHRVAGFEEEDRLVNDVSVSDVVVVDGDDIEWTHPSRIHEDIHKRAERLAHVLRLLRSMGYMHFVIWTTHDLDAILTRYSEVKPEDIQWKKKTSYSLKDVVTRASWHNCPFLSSKPLSHMKVEWDIAPMMRKWMRKNRFSMQFDIRWDSTGTNATICNAGSALPMAQELAKAPIPQPPPRAEPLAVAESEVVLVPQYAKIAITEGDEYSVYLVEDRGHWLVCFLLERDAMSSSLGQASTDIANHVVSANDLIERQDEEVPNLYSDYIDVSADCSWGWGNHLIVEVVCGQHAGLRAVGLGSNAKVRKRASRLAVSIAALARSGAQPDVQEEFMQIVSQVRQVLPGVSQVNRPGEMVVSRPRAPAPPGRQLQAVPPPPPPRKDIPAPPPGRMPLSARIGPALPPPGAPPPGPSTGVPPVNPPVPKLALGPPVVDAQTQGTQARPQIAAWTTQLDSACVAPPPPDAPPALPPPEIDSEWYAHPNVNSQTRSASDWLNTMERDELESHPVSSLEAHRPHPLRVSIPPSRPVPPSQKDVVGGIQSQLPHNARCVRGTHATVLRSFESHAAGYLAAEAGDRIEITCETVETGEESDPYEHYAFGRKLLPNGNDAKGWFPYCKDVIQVEMAV